MFHQGDLQSGISRAIQEQKLVACFVRQDDDYWSTIWEDHWLQNPVEAQNSAATDAHGDESSAPVSETLGSLLATKAVLLRIEYGSQEAGFLSAFCPVEKAPTLVVIDNGRLVERLEGGIGQDDFISRVTKALGFPVKEQQLPNEGVPEEHFPGTQAYADRAAAEEDTAQNTSVTATHQSDQQTETDIPMAASEPAAMAQPTSENIQPSASQAQEMLAERAMRLEAHKKAKEMAEKAQRIAKAKARQQEAQEAEELHKPDKGKQREGEPSSEKVRARQDWVRQQKTRNEEAKKERQRILQQIESDRLERKEREAQRRELVRMESQQSVLPGVETESTVVQPPASRGGAGSQTCSLQVRLFDGSSIRSRFDPDATLNASVRTWIRTASPPHAADIPYSFRQILAPRPSRAIEISEEQQTLQELGLIPTSTLVLVPVAGYTEAYASSGASGILSRGLSASYSFVSGVFGYAGSVIGAVTGYGRNDQGPYMGGTADEQEPSNTQGQTMAGSDFGSGGSADAGGSTAPIKVRTLFDQRAEADQAKKDDKRGEFYNGNSLDFEPDDEEEKK